MTKYLETMLMYFNQIKFKNVVVLVWLGAVFVDSGLQTPHKLNPSALSVD